jgi:NADP-dependent 3-hydroxy acid dehydrogenase YdfG
MRLDLLPYNIRVSQIAPGQAETEFSVVRFKGDEEKAKNVYQGFEALTAEDIADAILYVTQVPPHVNISDLLIMPTAQASINVIHRK